MFHGWASSGRSAVQCCRECSDAGTSNRPSTWATREVRRIALLAQGRGLSLFDAVYLWLTLERDAGLASRDADLLKAAAAAGQDVVDLREKDLS